MGLGRGGGGGAACPLVVETPPTPSALLKTESGARLVWGAPSLTRHPPTGPAPSVVSPRPVRRVLPILAGTLTTGRRPPPTPTWTRGTHPAEAREEADEAAESLPSGTTGSCTGSGIRGGLLKGGRGVISGGKEGFGEPGSGAERRKFGLSALRVGAESFGIARPHPRVAEAGVAGALMLFRERVPVRDSCVVRSCGGRKGRG